MEPEKTVAVKKAYAEIILNTAKEAAARVMAAERRALRFEHDLRSTKDEAVQMLLRLKQMIDSQTSEAEMSSLKKERKIEELEAQLYEAEDIITDLRSELKQAWGELERVDPSEVEPLNGETTREDASFSGNVTSGLKNIPVTRELDHKVSNGLEQTEQLTVSDLDKLRAPVYDFDSIIMRSKESELLRNGCTQRVRAFERNSFDGKLSLFGYEDNHKFQKKNELNELIVKASDNGIEVVKKPSLGETKSPVKVRTMQRKKTQFGKAKTSHLFCPTQLMSSCQPSSVDGNDGSHKDACIPPSIDACIPASVKDITRISSGLHSSCSPIDSKIIRMGKRKRNVNSEDGSSTSFRSIDSKIIQMGKRKRNVNSEDGSSTSFRSIDSKIIQMGKRKRNVNSEDGSSTSFRSTGQPSHVLSRCRTVAYLINGDVKSCEDRPNTAEKNEAKMKPLLRLDPGRTLIRRDVDPISGSASVKVSIKSGPGQNDADKCSELIDVSVSVKPGKDVVENSEAPSSEFSLGTGVVSGMNSDIADIKVLEQSNESPSHVGESGHLKNTFQRKRMNSSSNPDETALLEENTTKRRANERKSISPQPQNDSSRDSRRLAQVARQLISLSGKRWYK